jgi:hypothetical protein
LGVNLDFVNFKLEKLTPEREFFNYKENVMKEIRKIVHDERTYIESIGKHDKDTVREALAEKGSDTVIRVCIGVSGQEMPVRALGYFASAIAIQEHYFPEAELQFVYPLLAAEKVNGIDLDRGRESVENLDYVARRCFPRRYRKDIPEAGNIKSFFDGQLPDDDLQAAVGEVLASEPELSSQFRPSANTRGSDFTPYVAAHVLMHDTNPMLLPVVRGEPANTTERIISIGAQSERPFYLARMACQRAKLLPEGVQVATGQLFTKHVISPYLSCREGEPLVSTQNASTIHPVSSVQRDLEYLDRALISEADRYKVMIVPVEREEYCVGTYTRLEFA